MEKNILKAKEKLINEKCDGMALILKKELLKLIENDPALADGILDPSKNMESCIKYLYRWVAEQNTKKEKIVAVEHQKVFSEMIHYFLEVKEEKKAPAAITVNKTIENKPIQPKTNKSETTEKVEYACTLF